MSDQQAALDAAAAAKAAADAARQLTITQWTLYSFGILVTILRTYARFKAVGFNNFEGDDYFVWVAAVCFSLSYPCSSVNLCSDFFFWGGLGCVK